MNPYREVVKREPWYPSGAKERWRRRRWWARLACAHSYKHVGSTVCWSFGRCVKCRRFRACYIPSKA